MKSINFIKGSFLVVPNRQLVLKLRGAALPVYLSLCGYADDNGRGWPSYKRISEDTGYDKRQCQRAMQELVDAGLLSKMSRVRPDGGQTSNMFQIMIVDNGDIPLDTPLDIPDTGGGVDDTPWGGTDDTRGGGVDAVPELNQSELNIKNSKSASGFSAFNGRKPLAQPSPDAQQPAKDSPYQLNTSAGVERSHAVSDEAGKDISSSPLSPPADGRRSPLGQGYDKAKAMRDTLHLRLKPSR